MKSEVVNITIELPQELDQEICSMADGDNINAFIHDLIVRGLCSSTTGKDAA